MSTSERPERFALHLTAWYRAAGEAQWHHGITHSISTSGALIEGDDPAPAAGEIIVVIALPSADGCLVGRGRVSHIPTSANPAMFAVSVEQYQIEHRKSALSTAALVLQGC